MGLGESSCFVSVLLQRSGMGFTKTDITEPKILLLSSTRLVHGYTAAGYSVLNNAVFATKKGSDVSRHAQVVW